MANIIIVKRVHLRGLLRREGPDDKTGRYDYHWEQGLLFFHTSVPTGSCVVVTEYVNGVVDRETAYTALDHTYPEPFTKWASDREVTYFSP